MPTNSDKYETCFELTGLTTLLVVAETGSFHKAANALSIGQSAVSRRIARLENALGVSLFERRPSGATLTNAGKHFVVRARAIIEDLYTTVETARTAGVAGNGHLRIGLIASLSKGAVRTLVEAFVLDHADVDLCFEEADRSSLMTMLSHRTVDVVIASGEPAPETGDGHMLVREDIYLAVPANGPLANCEHLSWGDVADASFLVGAREPGPEIHDYIIRRVSDLGRPAHVRRQRLDREGIMNLVGLGFGVSLVADHWRGVQYPNVAFVPIGDEAERVPFSLTWRPENDNPALRRVVSLARVHARKAAAGDAASRTRDPSP